MEEARSVTSFAGDGGLHQLYVGLGVKVLKNLSVGANISYFWGEITRQARITFPYNDNAFAFQHVDYLSVRDYKLDFGAQYTQQLGRKHAVTLGVVFSPKKDLHNEAYVQRSTLTNSNSTQAVTTNTVDTVATFGMPNSFGVGLTYEYDKRLIVGADFNLQKWGDVTYMNQPNAFCDAGISTFVMLSTESILSISFTSSLSRYGGDLAVGAMTIITSVSQLATLPLQGICQGGQPIMSYNYGAGNRDRVKKAFFTQFTVCTIFTGCFWLIMLLFPKMFAGIFSNNTELITYTAWALRIYMAGIFSLGFQVACQQSFMALGQAKVSLLLACLRKLILLIPLIFILPHFIQNKVFAVFLAEPISDILAAIITTSTFFSRFNKILDRK